MDHHNNTSWFAGCETPEDVKAKYRELAFQHHPDRGGDTEIMKLVNSAYHAILATLHGHESVGSDGEAHTYYYHQAREQGAVEIIDRLLALHLPDDVEIWLIGTWVWVVGETKPHRAAFKALKLRWHTKRVAWYWCAPGRRTRYNSATTLAGLAETYGARRFAQDQREREAADRLRIAS